MRRWDGANDGIDARRWLIGFPLEPSGVSVRSWRQCGLDVRPSILLSFPDMPPLHP